MSSCIQEAFLLKDLSSSLSLYLSFCVSLSSSWSPPDEPWCSPCSDDVWYVSGSAEIAEMWLSIDDRLTDWRRRRREKATVRSAPDGSDNYIGRGGSTKTPKSDYVIYGWPLRGFAIPTIYHLGERYWSFFINYKAGQEGRSWWRSPKRLF